MVCAVGAPVLFDHRCCEPVDSTQKRGSTIYVVIVLDPVVDARIQSVVWDIGNWEVVIKRASGSRGWKGSRTKRCHL